MENERQTSALPPSDRATARLEIRLLGRFEVALDGVPIPPGSWRRRRPADLLKLVALAEGRTLSRERTIELLWPGKTLASGANNLHRALYDLRRVLGECWVYLERGLVRLRPEAWLDVDAFEIAASSGDPAARRAALELYRGDLSPEDRESPWLVDPRDRLRRLHAQLAIPQDSAPPGQGAAGCDGYGRAARRLLGTSDPAPLRGRLATLGLLHSTIEQGFGTLVLLGERGVGKTRLAIEGARIAQERGAIVLACACDDRVGGPLSPFAEALSDLGRGGGLFSADPGAERAESPADAGEGRKRRLQEEVRRSFAEAGGGRPVYLVVDDIHCADESSVDLFHFLARSAQSSKLILVATCREDEVRAGAPVQAVLSDLDCERLARGIRVQRLDLEATREQIGDLLGDAPSALLASRIYEIADGSPFYTEEITRTFQESDEVSANGDQAALVRARAMRLGPEAEALLTAAAVRGRRFDLAVVGPASGLEAHDAALALDLCSRARLLEENGTGHQFHHSLLREVLYEGLDRSRRVELHRAIADAIEARAASGAAGPFVELLAIHRRLGEQPGEAFRHLLSAGRLAVARSALREALGFLGQALSIAQAGACPVEEVGLLDLLESTIRVQLGLGDLSGAGRTFEMTAERRERAAASGAREAHWASLCMIAGGNLTRAREVLASVADQADGQVPCLLAELHWHASDCAIAIGLAERCAAERHAALDSDPAGAGCEVGMLIHASSDGGTITPVVCERARLARSGRPFDVDLAIWERRLAGDRPRGEVEAAVALYGEQARLGRNARSVAVARSVEGALALARADWDRADATLRNAVELQRAQGTAQGEAFALDRLGTLLTVRGHFEDGMAVLLEGVTAAQRGALRRHGLTRLHASLARNRLAAGAVYAAEDCIRQAGEIAAQHGECAICDTHFRPEAIRVALARGRVGEAEAETAQLEAIAEKRGERLIGAFARFSRGRVLAAQGRRDEAQAAVEEARQTFAAVGEVFEAARCLTVEGHLLSMGCAEGTGPVGDRSFVGAAIADV